MRVIIAAAGTGGHINPGIAIANKIKEQEKDSEIIFSHIKWPESEPKEDCLRTGRQSFLLRK